MTVDLVWDLRGHCWYMLYFVGTGRLGGSICCQTCWVTSKVWPSKFMESLRVALLLALPDLFNLLGHVEIALSKLLDLLSEFVDR